MAKPLHELSRRERQIMDVLFRRGRASAAQVRQDLPDPPSYSAVRAQLRILEEKGYAAHDQEGPRYVYRPAVAREKAKRTAIQHLVDTFFDGSVGRATVALLDDDAARLSKAELDRLSKLVEEARRRERDATEEEDS